MDNVVQNINIEDIIPSNFKPSIEEKRKIDELAILIKQFGLLEPILVRPKNNKYEIIMGMDKYQASLIANQNTIPVIIKEINDDIYSKYSNIDTNKSVSLNILPKETFYKKEQNSDIINLSELSKINLEYERDDVKMNNGQFNNDMTNNNFGQTNMKMNQQTQGPTFGGRFFPSLEDEPTNMNMMNGPILPPSAPIPPTNNNDFNNNLIDLTDLSLEKETSPMAPTDFGVPTMNIPTLEPSPNPNLNQPLNNNFDTTNFGINNMTTNDNIINLESLQNNNQGNDNIINLGSLQNNNVANDNIVNLENFQNTNPTNDNIVNLESFQNNNPAINPISEPVSMDILNADFGAPQTPMNQPTIEPPADFNIQNQQNFNTQAQPDFGLNQPIQQMTSLPQMPSFDINHPMTNQQPSYESIIPTPTVETNITSSKDVTPVTNTIKNLVTSLEAFGYKFNIIEEDLANMAKIIIEVEK